MSAVVTELTTKEEPENKQDSETSKQHQDENKDDLKDKIKGRIDIGKALDNTTINELIHFIHITDDTDLEIIH